MTDEVPAEMTAEITAEEKRLSEDRDRTAYWRRWGSYLSDRQWGTVREDYSEDGSAWAYFPHDQARSRAYRWGEDGIAGLCDNHQRLCFSIALWNEQDPILKERLFGLSGEEGNHGEDVKEYYFYLDNLPSHAYMKALYKYPQQAFPYADLVEENQRRDRSVPEYELLDTGIFDGDRYFDVFIEYAKAAPEDILIQLTIINRSAEPQPLHLLPTLWFRNTWSWHEPQEKPSLKVLNAGDRVQVLEADHPELETRWLYCEGLPELLFTENETNTERVFGQENRSPYVKDSFDDYVIHHQKSAVNPEQVGTKAAAHYVQTIEPNGTWVVRLRLCDSTDRPDPFGAEFEQVMGDRIREADQFYQRIAPNVPLEESQIQRQAFAGMLWSKQFYHYVVEDWLKGKPAESQQPPRNSDWTHLVSEDILSVPDTWEYPWFATWDLAFQVVSLALIDPDFAKQQLLRLTREWYMHPNGQLPAYEWDFGDVNPPVHAWAARQVYEIEQQLYGRQDQQFLERIFQKLLFNFTWWVNREDISGKNVFQGGFLGLDNIGVFDRSSDLPTGGSLEQADGTSWMAMYCIDLLTIAVELTFKNPIYEDVASKFFEHFLYITAAINGANQCQMGLWDEEDGFYYDALRFPDGNFTLMKVRSLVGLVPLFAVGTMGAETIQKLTEFKRRGEWFMQHRQNLTSNIACLQSQGVEDRHLLAILDRNRLLRVLEKLLDESEFLSPYGIRSLSKYHADHPYVFHMDSEDYSVEYEPAESRSELFGGNSNWRGPIWFPTNYLIISALERFYTFWGDELRVECPTGSGNWMNLKEVAIELTQRLKRIYLRGEGDRRPVSDSYEKLQSDPHWRDYYLFHEYFHADNGTGLGASHQTGWTGLIANLIHQAASD